MLFSLPLEAMRIVAEHAGRKAGEPEEVTVKRRHMLNLVAGDGATLILAVVVSSAGTVARINRHQFACITKAISLMLSVLGCSGMIVTFVNDLLEKPGALATRLKVSAGSAWR